MVPLFAGISASSSEPGTKGGSQLLRSEKSLSLAPPIHIAGPIAAPGQFT